MGPRICGARSCGANRMSTVFGPSVSRRLEYGRRWLISEGEPPLLFTGNETNFKRLFAVTDPLPYVKDAFNEYLIHGKQEAVNPAGTGTKAAALYRLEIQPAASATLRLRLTDTDPAHAERARIVRPEFRRNVCHADRRSRRVLRSIHPAQSFHGRRERPAPGLRRNPVVQAVLPL